MSNLISVGIIVIGLLIVVGWIVLRQCIASVEDVYSGVIVDVRGHRIPLPLWTWKEISILLTKDELIAFDTAVNSMLHLSTDYDVDDVRAIARINTITWQWMTTTPNGRSWLQKNYPQLLPEMIKS